MSSNYEQQDGFIALLLCVNIIPKRRACQTKQLIWKGSSPCQLSLLCFYLNLVARLRTLPGSLDIWHPGLQASARSSYHRPGAGRPTERFIWSFPGRPRI